jgi:hypothetical protein
MMQLKEVMLRKPQLQKLMPKLQLKRLRKTEIGIEITVHIAAFIMKLEVTIKRDFSLME